MNHDYDAIIIGAGVIGACTGFELARKGYRTLNVDKQPAAGSGSTSSTCAIIRFHYSTPEGCAMARESYFHWLDWGRYLGVPDEMGLAKYVNTGCLVVKNDGNHDLVRVTAVLDELHVAYEDLRAEEVAARFPWIDTRAYGPPVSTDDERFGEPTGGHIRGAVYIPESGYIDDPTLACHNVQRACEARGGEFRFGAEVVEILREGGRAPGRESSEDSPDRIGGARPGEGTSERVAGVRLADGSIIRAPVVVNVGGPHSAIINGMAGVLDGMNVRTRPLKKEVCYVPAPADMDYHQVAPLISDGDIGCYSRPTTGNQVLIGSQDPECDVPEWVDDPDDYNTGFTRQWETQVMREAQRVKGLGIPGQTGGLVDLYDVADDWIPIYDMSDLPGFYMAVGTSGNQFKNAPVAGKLMAELIEQVEGGRDHDADPVSIPLKYTRRTCDIGFFSRRRPPNPDSSYTVIG
ncbi:MAG: FAD-dependent oxidoreductase [Gemmatimonadota bacterium]|nr:FAD-dependent oxidoreductase [Gemmatimonadota bacterium]MDE2870845.1 FAD-dependent oxidoreductase [Gemmatimonadota bacterium]